MSETSWSGPALQFGAAGLKFVVQTKLSTAWNSVYMFFYSIVGKDKVSDLQTVNINTDMFLFKSLLHQRHNVQP